MTIRDTSSNPYRCVRYVLAVGLANVTAWFVIYSHFLGSFFYSPNPFAPALSLLQVLPGVVAAVLAFRKAAGSVRGRRRIWILLASAFLLWAGAGALDLFAQEIGSSFAVVSGRILHLTASVFAFWGVFLFVQPAAGFARLRHQIDLLIHTASWGLVLWFLVVEPILQPGLGGSDSRIWIALNAIWGLDLMMLVLWLQGQSARPLPSLWGLAAGFFFKGVFDLVSGWLSLQSGANPLLWAGYLSIAAAIAFALASSVEDEERPADIPDVSAVTRWQVNRRSWQRIEARWLPVISTLALVIFVFNGWRRYGVVDPLLIWSTVALCLLLFLREGVIAGQATLSGYAVLLDNIKDPAFICGQDGRVSVVNNALRHIGVAHRPGAKIQDILGTAPSWNDLLRQAHAAGWEGEISVKPEEHDAYPAWLVLHPLPREEGEHPRLACILHDLTPQRRQEEELREAYRQAEEARERLEQFNRNLEGLVRDKTADLEAALHQLEEQNRMLLSLDRMKSEFIALTSHELRTPLAGIRAGLELLLSRKPPLESGVSATLSLVQMESERLIRFVESILNLTALEAGKMPLQIAPLSVVAMLEQTRRALAAVHGGMNSPNMKRLTVELPPNLPDIMADEHVLASAVYQLADNAFKYAPGSKVLISVRAGDSQVEIRISDDGPGISTAEREQLFRSFTRLGSADSPNVKGAGLGLYLSRKMVEGMGGTLELLSEGEGFALSLLLPAAMEEV